MGCLIITAPPHRWTYGAPDGCGAAQAKREKKAFLNDPSALAHPPAGPYTVPEPFALSGYDEERKARKEATRRQAADGAMAECTFRPQTNEGRVRDMLDKILAVEGGR